MEILAMGRGDGATVTNRMAALFDLSSDSILPASHREQAKVFAAYRPSLVGPN